MGTRNVSYRRREKMARDLSRRGAKRAPYEKVLIVCEGEKTEPNYFNELKDHYRLSSANVVICGNCNSDPLGVFKYAEKCYSNERRTGDPYDKVFCVFDKDAHATYQKAIDSLTRATPKNVYFTINSVPCFEYWMILHYNYTTKPYTPLPGNSSGNQVLTELRTHIPAYIKGDKETFSILMSKIEHAKINSIRSLTAAKNSNTDNPSTRVHELVTFLQEIK